MLNCRLKVISPYNHGSSKCERQIKTISEIIVKHLWDKGQMWPLFTSTAAYAMNTFAFEALSSFSPCHLETHQISQVSHSRRLILSLSIIMNIIIYY